MPITSAAVETPRKRRTTPVPAGTDLLLAAHPARLTPEEIARARRMVAAQDLSKRSLEDACDRAANVIRDLRPGVLHAEETH